VFGFSITDTYIMNIDELDWPTDQEPETGPHKLPVTHCWWNLPWLLTNA